MTSAGSVSKTSTTVKPMASGVYGLTRRESLRNASELIANDAYLTQDRELQKVERHLQDHASQGCGFSPQSQDDLGALITLLQAVNFRLGSPREEIQEEAELLGNVAMHIAQEMHRFPRWEGYFRDVRDVTWSISGVSHERLAESLRAPWNREPPEELLLPTNIAEWLGRRNAMSSYAIPVGPSGDPETIRRLGKITGSSWGDWEPPY